jgi:hypothetical protein
MLSLPLTGLIMGGVFDGELIVLHVHEALVAFSYVSSGGKIS